MHGTISLAPQVSLLDGDNLCAVVHSLSLLTSLLINENLGQKLFNPQNIDQTLQMAINLMQDAFPAAVSSPSQSYGRSVSGLLKALQRRAPVRCDSFCFLSLSYVCEDVQMQLSLDYTQYKSEVLS